jgi:signal peptidase
MAEELPDYLKAAEKKLVEKKEEKPKKAPAKRPPTERKAQERPKPKIQPYAKKVQSKSLRERWDDMAEGPFGTLIYIVLGFMIALAVNEMLKPVLATDTPVVAVFSESMLPTLEKGDLVVVRGGQEIKLGDIVIYDSPIYKYPIIHRVVSISDQGVTTKGDNNSVADPWVTPLKKIHGTALMRIPYLGWVKVGAYELLGLA